MPFEMAREYARSLNIAGIKAWRTHCKSAAKPYNIPAGPEFIYPEFTTYGDWLGRTIRPKFRDFESARSFVHSLGFKKWKEWQNYAQSQERPVDIPKSPEAAYKNKGWISVGDWIGTYSSSYKYRNWRAFYEAREYVHSLKIPGQKGWTKFCKSGLRPMDIPAAPDWLYAEWKSWEDWTGIRLIKSFRPFGEARAFVQSLGLRSVKEWHKYASSGKRPKDIPTVPYRTYNDEWISYKDWLGKIKRND